MFPLCLSYLGYGFCVPTGMNYSKAVLIEPHRERAKPLQVESKFPWLQLQYSFGVLMNILVAVPAQELSRLFRVFGVICQGVQLVVTHDGQGMPFLDHGPDDFKHLSNLWATVDEISEKDHLTEIGR